jgi:hypothetical protein
MLSTLTLYALAVALPISQSSTVEPPSPLKLCRAAAAEGGGNHVAFGMHSRRPAVS